MIDFRSPNPNVNIFVLRIISSSVSKPSPLSSMAAKMPSKTEIFDILWWRFWHEWNIWNEPLDIIETNEWPELAWMNCIQNKIPTQMGEQTRSHSSKNNTLVVFQTSPNYQCPRALPKSHGFPSINPLICMYACNRLQGLNRLIFRILQDHNCLNERLWVYAPNGEVHGSNAVGWTATPLKESARAHTQTHD